MVVACTRDCYDTCIFSEDYRPLNLFPVNGFTCSRGRTDLKRNEINRVMYPIVEGKEVDIKEAIRKTAEIIKGTPKDLILHVDYDGNQGLLTWYFPSRLWNALGSLSTDYSICSAEGHEAIKLHYGSSLGALPEDFEKFGSVVFWGSEAVFSFIHGWTLLKDKYKVTIDVRLSETAKRSEKKYIIKPSSDSYLAVGVLKHLIKGIPPQSLLDDPVKLRNYLDSYSWSEIEEVTGLSRASIEELAEIYVERRPLTVIGFALGRTYHGGHAISLISLIPALLGIPNGFYYSNSQGLGIDFNYLRGLHLARPSGIVPMAKVGDYIEEGKVKVLFVWNSNPLHSLPKSHKILKAVRDGELKLIVHDPFNSETAKVANIVIPAPTFLEKYDVVYSYWHNLIVFNEPIRPKIGVDEVTLMRLLAKEMNLSHPLLEEDEWGALDHALRGTGVTVQKLKEEKIVKVNVKKEIKRVKVDPLPELKRPPEGDYLVFSSHPNHTNSQFKEIYGSQGLKVYNCCYDGAGLLEGNGIKVRVKFVKNESIPKGVFFAYKSDLVDGEALLNTVVSGEMNDYAQTPVLNGVIRVIMK
ncbi:molybdopterin-dependent oxidoreductase [Stygiolobus caldivivus]|uniref:Dehydrogenase n=1 Tax=Stygiolobus caldivivus TaxID=2824673 RepID=A0A8D5U6Q4_9CREN|nr:molybdopterin-dependent oxidoreductase [Stygiolobus caldivivus]BCU70324.1 dehydrogenase [Stygiolobus caldivivus]